MKTIKKILGATGLMLIIALLSVSLTTFIQTLIKYEKEVEIELPQEIKPILTHRQMVWSYTLEWCESRGVIEAVNKKDRDGTPSYYSYQFKPGTFRFYGELYGVIPKGLKDEEIMEKIKVYDLQRAIVVEMILHQEDIDWKNQFPDCVKKYGKPPTMLQ